MAHDDKRDSKHPAAADEAARKNPAAGPPAEPDSKAGMEQEVGDLDDPDAVEDEGALPGRMGGGLAGG
ncbi:MAG: hypothetical protein M3Q42_04900 [Pseudomonadota bacterium]|nr:hypothetical protein [Pseudomonadota bacterium]